MVPVARIITPRVTSCHHSRVQNRQIAMIAKTTTAISWYLWPGSLFRRIIRRSRFDLTFIHVDTVPGVSRCQLTRRSLNHRVGEALDICSRAPAASPRSKNRLRLSVGCAVCRFSALCELAQLYLPAIAFVGFAWCLSQNKMRASMQRPHLRVNGLRKSMWSTGLRIDALARGHGKRSCKYRSF